LSKLVSLKYLLKKKGAMLTLTQH